MNDLKKYTELSVQDKIDIDNYLEILGNCTPLQVDDYIRLKRYIRKILEIIEKDKELNK